MEEGNSGGNFNRPESLNQAQHLFKKPFEKPKPAARRVHKKKAVLGQFRKKLNEGKSGKSGVASNGVEDEGLHDWPGLVSSTSATESSTEENKKKLIVGKKSGKSHIDFAKFEDSLRTTPFAFQKRLSRIDWRKLHTTDVDKIVREVDLVTLEAVVDTIAFSDIQGEDTRNFTEANFVKIFRLAQLMVIGLLHSFVQGLGRTRGTGTVKLALLTWFIGNSTNPFSDNLVSVALIWIVEYLLHVQELLAAQKSQLLADGTIIQRRMEKHKERFAKLLTDLTNSRHDLKQAKKILRIYEAMLKVQGENQQQQQMERQQQQSVTQQMVRCCPLCDKLFESSYYLGVEDRRDLAKLKWRWQLEHLPSTRYPKKVFDTTWVQNRPVKQAITWSKKVAELLRVANLSEKLWNMSESEMERNVKEAELEAAQKSSISLMRVYPEVPGFKSYLIGNPTVAETWKVRTNILYGKSSFYLSKSSPSQDLHVGRRHPKPNDIPEDKILAVVSKAEEATAARVKAETTAVLQSEIQHFRSMSQAEIQRTEAAAQFQIATLQASLRESNSKVQEVQNKLEQLQAQVQNLSVTSARKNVVPVGKGVKDLKTQEKLKELEDQLQGLYKELKDLTHEKTNLMKELESTKSEVSLLKAAKRKNVIAERKDIQIVDLGDYHQAKTHGKKGKLVEDLDTPTTSDNQDRVMGDENSDTSSKGTKGKDRRTRRKHQKNRFSSPLSSGKEEKQKNHKKLKDHSSPERKRKQRLHDDQSNKTQKSGVPTRHSDSAPPSPRPPKDAYYETYRYTDRESNDERATLSKKFKQWKESLASRQVPDKHTVKSSAELRSEDKEMLGVAKADLELDLARAEEKRLGIQKVGKVGATKKTKREMVKTPGRQRPIQEKEIMTREKRSLQAEKEWEMERLAKETAEVETRRRLEIAAAASMDVGEDGPIIPIAEKEKWLQERPYKPIPQRHDNAPFSIAGNTEDMEHRRPHAVSKYPHPPSVFESKRDDLVNLLHEQLGGELKKFGFSSDTEGISDSIHQAATAALEKQNKHRASVLQTNQKKSLEYERGAIVWHTQRAVRERDIQIIESHFEEESDETSSSGLSGRADSPFTDDEDDEHTTEKETCKTITTVAPQIKDQHYIGDRFKREAHLLDESQPGVSENSWSTDKKQLNYSANSYSRKQMNRFKIQTQSPNGGLLSYQQYKDNSRGPLPTKYSPPWGQTKKDAEEENCNEREAAFGLGQWESDEEMHSQGRRIDSKEDNDQDPRTHENFSEDGSEESKIFKELDAEIDEIIRL